MSRKKFYAPANVKNPTSMQHMVWLQPGQTLLLHLDASLYPESKIEISTPYLKSLPCEAVDSVKRYVIVQEQSVIPWGDYSSSFLGDIWIDSKQRTARLAAIMSCTNPAKSRVMTVINPDCSEIRIKPFHVLEVVLYDQRFRDQDEWVWEWKPKVEGLELEQIGYEYLNLHMWRRYYDEGGEESSHLYARLARTDTTNPWCRQHHLWFRFKEPILSAMQDDVGTKHAGDIQIYGWGDRYNRAGDFSESFLSVYVDLRKKHRDQTLTTLACPPRGDWTPLGTRPPINNLVAYRKKKGKYSSPDVRSVTFSVLDFKSFDEGCKTMEATPVQIAQYLDDGDCANVSVVRNYHHRRYGGCGFPHYDDYDDDRRGIYDWYD